MTYTFIIHRKRVTRGVGEKDLII